MGVSWNEFWEMNPRIIKAISEGYSERIKSETERNNNMAYLQGKYFVDGILSTVGNMFSKGKPFEYPKEPYQLFGKRELTEEEKQREVDLFFEREEVRRKNWKRTHKKRGGENGN